MNLFPEKTKEAEEQENKIKHLLKLSNISKRKDIACELMTYLGIIQKTGKGLNADLLSTLFKLEFTLGPYLGSIFKPLALGSEEEYMKDHLEKAITPSKIAKLSKMYQAYGKTQKKKTSKNFVNKFRKITLLRKRKEFVEDLKQPTTKGSEINALPEIRDRPKKAKMKKNEDMIERHKALNTIDNGIVKQITKNRKNLKNRKSKNPVHLYS